MTTTLDVLISTPTPGVRAGVRIEAEDLVQTVRGGRRILDGVSLTIVAGEVVAIVGGSGAGKSTLLDALAGVRPARAGHVRFDGVDLYGNLSAFRSSVGYVPQDDIIHRDLPLAATLRYAARLRLPRSTARDEIDAVVADVLATLDLTARADVPVGKLSGGERKRASIGVELLTRPVAMFLDEPTSGLDPATAARLMRALRRLAAQGCTVVFTTHNVRDITSADTVVMLGRRGRPAYHGAPAAALDQFGVSSFEEIYEQADAAPVLAPSDNSAVRAAPQPPAAVRHASRPPAGRIGQWRTLTRRNIHILTRNRLSLAIMLGTPVLVIAMFAILFEPGTFDAAHASPSAVVMLTYWMAFAGFFFGLTYGLLQICTELPILRRERFVNLGIGAYLLSKVSVLLPVLFAVDVAMLAVLRAFDRLPSAGFDVYVALAITLLIDAATALALGLLASASVADAGQATIALPLLCFPAVLFSGAILPVRHMTLVGRAISVVTPDRWAFEAAGRTLDLDGLFHASRPATGSGALADFGSTFSGHVVADWIAMAAFAGVFLGAAYLVLLRRGSSGRTRRPS